MNQVSIGAGAGPCSIDWVICSLHIRTHTHMRARTHATGKDNFGESHRKKVTEKTSRFW